MYGAFEIDVLYEVAAESPHSLYIRDPQDTLLDLLRFLRANSRCMTRYSLDPPGVLSSQPKRTYVTLTLANIHAYFEAQPE